MIGDCNRYISEYAEGDLKTQVTKKLLKLMKNQKKKQNYFLL